MPSQNGQHVCGFIARDNLDGERFLVPDTSTKRSENTKAKSAAKTAAKKKSSNGPAKKASSDLTPSAGSAKASSRATGKKPKSTKGANGATATPSATSRRGSAGGKSKSKAPATRKASKSGAKGAAAKKRTSKASATPNKPWVIGIGASAGGLGALKEFFDNVTDDCRLSFIIVQHLSPDYKSLMADLLQKNTGLPIHEAKSNMRVVPGNVYLIPPKKNMTIHAGRLKLTDKPSRHDLNLPIDIFFRSLAEECGESSIAIVLSGTGSDGTRGVRAIKEAGGMVMVQNPEQAGFDGMPISAINTGLVDYVLPVQELPGELLHFIDTPAADGSAERSLGRDSESLYMILTQVKKITGLDFHLYKKPTLIRRVARRMSIKKCHKLGDYLEVLNRDPRENQTLCREFLIGVTRFFRDSAAWSTLETQVLPDLVKLREKQILKVWCVACSTGEEVYSIAILLTEVIERSGLDVGLRIFATDIESDYLEVASRGLYPESIVADVSPERLQRFFKRQGDDYQIIDHLRKSVIFSRHNVIQDPPFSKMDLVICRNMLIYLQAEAQEKVMGMLHYALNLNGVLFLGGSETVGDHARVLKEVNRKGKLYRNIQLGRLPMNHSPDFSGARTTNRLALSTQSQSAPENLMADILNESVAEELGLAGIYIDDTFNIVHAQGEVREFIRLPESGFSINLMKLLSGDLKLAISSAVHRCAKTREKCVSRGIKQIVDDKVRLIDLVVRPFTFNGVSDRTNFLVLLVPRSQETVTIQAPASGEYDASLAQSQRVYQLEEELKHTSESLQAAIEELETSNEELQATNEELLAANEELQSTNEELQSVNEELHTVNSEHQQKIDDLAAANADMDNLLASTDIGTIFLDSELKIRRFTPAINAQFNLQRTDTGRRIDTFSSRIGNDTLLKSAKEVLATARAVEQQVQTEDGRWYLQRITPFVDSAKNYDGVVVTFIDIETVKVLESEVIASEEKYRALFDESPVMQVALHPRNNTIQNCNQMLCDSLGYSTPSELIGKSVVDLHDHDSTAHAKRALSEFRKSGNNQRPELTLSRTDGSKIQTILDASLVKDPEGQPIQVICTWLDISELSAERAKFLDQNLAFEQVLESSMAGYWDWNIRDDTEYLSPTFKKMFGYAGDEMDENPEVWQSIAHPDDLKKVNEVFDRHVASKGKVPYDNELRYHHKDGRIVWVLCRGEVIEWDSDDKPVRMVGSHVNITELKQTQEALARSNSELEQFAYMASHDLKAPISNLEGLLELAEQNKSGLGDPDLRRKIRHSVGRMTRTVDTLNEVISIRADKKPERRRLKIANAFENVLKTLETQVDQSGAVIATDFSTCEWIVYPPLYLQHILQNLMSNAIKYKKPNGPLRISVKAEKTDRGVKLTVRDNGQGIDLTKYGKKLFGLYQRFHLDVEGKGIGLHLTKHIVENTGGSINVASKPGKGTTFEVYLV
ncbi:MAG: chemotaxis protein CheB [Pseudomonadota bacterium]